MLVKPATAVLEPTHPLYANVVGLWAFCEPVPTAADAVIASPLSTAFNGVAGVLPARIADPVYGPVASFTGTEWFKCGNVGDFERTDSFSIFIILKSSVDAGAGYLYAKLAGAGGGFRGYRMLKEPGGNISFVLSNTGGTNMIEVNYGVQLTVAGGWTALCTTYSGSSAASGVNFYKNGVLTAGTTATDSLTGTTKTTEEFTIGARTATAPATFFTGNIAYLAMFNKELSDAEQLSVHNNPLGLLTITGRITASNQNSLNLSLHR